jgi:STE24 endopeptidase
MKGAAAMLALILLAIAAFYALIRRAGRAWWKWGGALAVALLAFVVAISPVYVEPLFNEYTPMPAGPLRDDILSLARANGVPAEDVLIKREAHRMLAWISWEVGFGIVGIPEWVWHPGKWPSRRAAKALRGKA